MERLFFALAAIFGALAVGLGAFGAHALEGRVAANLLSTYETSVRYHFYHVIALLAVAFAISRWPGSGLPVTAGWLFVAGIVIFSGSLYLLTFTGQRWLGAITPIGGVAFIVGWVLLAVTAWRA
ncbi:MAG: DUF423 domain-containing protein [Caldilineaceae bacterium]|nr:DUF423 domain-containing protein [Caldilineaceae bacterium]